MYMYVCVPEAACQAAVQGRLVVVLLDYQLLSAENYQWLLG